MKTNKGEAQYKRTWNYIIGSAGSESTEHRIFNAVCVFSFIAVFLSVLFNYSIGLTKLTIVQSFFLFVQVLVYGLSRFMHKFSPATVLYALMSYLFLACNFLYNDGISGPTLLAFFLSFHFLASITPEHKSWIWVPLHIGVVGVLSFLQYRYPALVKHNYPSTLSRVIDINFTYYVLVLITYLITRYVRRKYNEEQKIVALQKATIEEKNSHLEYIDKERSRLFSIIAHDLRSPLTSINGYLELLTSGSLDNSERALMEKQLLNLSTHTVEMLNNLLFWSRSQLEGTGLNIRSLNVKDTLRTTVEIQRTIAEKKGIEVTSSIPDDIYFKADRDNIDLVIRNILSNAIKFTRPQGFVGITAGLQDGKVVVVIKDNGVGIPKDQQAMIFTSEIKSMRGTSEEHGVGLGLYLCKEFIEAQDGSISFESKSGEGTIFYIWLDAAQPKP